MTAMAIAAVAVTVIAAAIHVSGAMLVMSAYFVARAMKGMADPLDMPSLWNAVMLAAFWPFVLAWDRIREFTRKD